MLHPTVKLFVRVQDFSSLKSHTTPNKMNFPGMPPLGGAAGGGVSQQEQATVKMVWPNRIHHVTFVDVDIRCKQAWSRV